MHKFVVLPKSRMHSFRLASYFRKKRTVRTQRHKAYRSRSTQLSLTKSCVLQILVVAWLVFLFLLCLILGMGEDESLEWERGSWSALKESSNEQNRIKNDFSMTENVGVNHITQPGEMGQPFLLPERMSQNDIRVVKKGWKTNGFNQYVSDLISVKRSLPDPRDEWCKSPSTSKMLPLSKLPVTSVIICFHNEAWSTLLRTVHSVLNRSPTKLLGEIILIDDCSQMNHLKAKLDKYMSSYQKVKIVRSQKRLGLIRARMMGASIAKGPVLTFLDSHVEVTRGWLEPLLDRIARDTRTVVCPVIDVIDDNTLEYNLQKSSDIQMGGFDWSLTFRWFPVPEREMERRRSPAEPLNTPAMAGGLFAIDKNYFEYLGSYDPGFEIWGGENLELSFKTWMCGGKLEIVPCSHVGHIFRDKSPYEWLGNEDVLKRNSVRLATVWMDEYAKLYYARIKNDLGAFGDISSRVELRKSLKCKDFGWYLNNIFPELYIPKNVVADGEIMSLYGAIIESSCIQAPSNLNDEGKLVQLNPCTEGENDQYWTYTTRGEIRRDLMCIDFNNKALTIYQCHEQLGNQFWVYDYDKGFIRHPATGQCMVAAGPDPDVEDSSPTIYMQPCYQSSYAQRWRFERFNKTVGLDFIENYVKVKTTSTTLQNAEAARYDDLIYR